MVTILQECLAGARASGFRIWILLGLESPGWITEAGPLQSVCEDGACGAEFTRVLNMLAGAINFRFLEAELLKLTKSLTKHAPSMVA